MPANIERHRIRPLGRSMEARSRPGFDQERDAETRQRNADAAFLRHFAMCQERYGAPGVDPKLTLIG